MSRSLSLTTSKLFCSSSSLCINGLYHPLVAQHVPERARDPRAMASYRRTTLGGGGGAGGEGAEVGSTGRPRWVIVRQQHRERTVPTASPRLFADGDHSEWSIREQLAIAALDLGKITLATVRPPPACPNRALPS
jgi:hypothetical protein